MAMAVLIYAGTMAQAQFGSAEMSFLNIIDSPRAVGMGTCVANMIDEQAALYNPGALGLLHLEKRLAFTYPVATGYLEDIADDITFKTFSISAGMRIEMCPAQTVKGDEFSPALGHSRAKLDLGESRIRDESGNIIYTFRPCESADNFTFAVGADYFLRVGLGATYKRARSRYEDWLSINASTYDFCFIFEFPVMGWISSNDLSAAGGKPRSGFELTPSIAYVNSNNGNDISSSHCDGYRLPHISRFGVSVYSAWKRGLFRIVSVRIAVEKETDFVGSEHESIDKLGGEIGIGGALFIRAGYVDYPWNEGLSTYGFGASLKGLLSYLRTYHGLHIANPFWDGVMRRLDLTFDYGAYGQGKAGLTDTDFMRMSISF